MEPLKVILLVIHHSAPPNIIQRLAQKLEKMFLRENLGHIQNLILSDSQRPMVDKKIEQMTNTNCDVLIILNFSSLTNLPHNQFINHKLVLSLTPDFTENTLLETLQTHQKEMERSFGCKKGRCGF